MTSIIRSSYAIAFALLLVSSLTNVRTVSAFCSSIAAQSAATGTTASSITVRPSTQPQLLAKQQARTSTRSFGLFMTQKDEEINSSDNDNDDDNDTETTNDNDNELPDFSAVLTKKEREIELPFSAQPLNGNSVDPKETTTTATTLSQDTKDQATLATSTPVTSAPQLSFDKFVTMQDKRVVVTIRYSGDAGLKPYFLTVAKKIKASHPDVVMERRILADVDNTEQDEATFEVLVDQKIVLGRGKKQLAQHLVFFVSMQELDVAISRARRKKRPTTTYGQAAAVGV